MPSKVLPFLQREVLTFCGEMWEGIGGKMVCAVTSMSVVLKVGLSTVEAAVGGEEVEWVLHTLAPKGIVTRVTAKLTVLGLLRLSLLLLATAAELTEGKGADGVDVVGRGGRGQLTEGTSAGTAAATIGRRVDQRTEHLAETRVETDALAADEGP